MSVLRFATEAEMLAVPDAHYWHDVGSELPYVALTGEDAPVATAQVAECTQWQLRKWLNANNLRKAVEDYVAASSQDVKDGWEYATKYVSTDEFVLTACAALNLDAYAVISAASLL